MAIRPRHRAILARLDEFLRELRGSAPLRRRLLANTRVALVERGFASDHLPETLPPPRRLDPLLTHGQLFGLATAAERADPGLELRLLAYGAKPLVLVHGLEADLCAALAWAERRRFTAILSADEWDRHRDTGKGDYSNLAMNMRQARPGSGAWRSLLVGVDEDRVVLAWLALTLGWDELLGRLLGYPACCTAAFSQRWAEAVAEHQGDVVAACLRDSGGGPYDWRVNILGRYFGAELIHHFPCRFDCAPSLALAAQTAAVLEVCEPALHAETRDILNAPAIYTETAGVAILRHARVTEPESLTLSYESTQLLVTAASSDLDRALRGGHTLRADSGNGRVVVGDSAFEGSLVIFADQPMCSSAN